MRRALVFGPLIKHRRREMDLTLSALCRKVVLRGRSISKGYLSGIENGKVAPPADPVVLKLATALGLSREGLLLIAHLDKLPEQLLDTYAALRALRDDTIGTVRTKQDTPANTPSARE